MSLSYRAFKWFTTEKLKEILNNSGMLYTGHKISEISLSDNFLFNIKNIIERGDTLFNRVLVKFEDQQSQNYLLIGPMVDGVFIINGSLLMFQNELKDEQGVYFIKKVGKGRESVDKGKNIKGTDEKESASKIYYEAKIVSDDFRVIKIEKRKGSNKVKIGEKEVDLSRKEAITEEIKKRINNLYFSEKTLQKINSIFGFNNIKSNSLAERHLESILSILKTEDEKFFKEENPSDISTKRIFHFGCFLENSVREFLKEKKTQFYGKDNVLIIFYLISYLNDKIFESFFEKERTAFTFLFPLNPLDTISGTFHIQRYYGKIQEQLSKEYRNLSEDSKGILCPYETPESKLIGLSLHLLPDVEIDYNNHKLVPSHDNKILGIGASLIPFVNFNDGVRISMASKNMKQALPLKNPETPYIKTGLESKIHEFITTELKDKYFEDFFDNNSQEFHYGMNALVAYMPFNGYNFNDAIVISESFSKRCTVLKNNEYKEKVNSTLFEIQETEKVKRKDYIRKGDVLWKVIYKLSSYPCKEEKAQDDGEIINFEKFSDSLVESIYIQTKKRHILQIGDKLMNRHANKGVIGRIVKDEEMPCLPDGTPIDVILNPMGIITRMNIGQLLETHFGFVHWFYNRYRDSDFIEKKKIEEFIKKYSEVGSIFKLSEHEISELSDNLKLISDYLKRKDPRYPNANTPPGTIFLKNGKNGEYFKYPVVVGSQYIMVLNHLSEDKIWARGFPEWENSYDRVTGQPLSGKAINGGQRIGEMEVWCLLAHRAFSILTEIFAMDNLFNRKQIKSGVLKNVYVGNTFKAFCYYLKGLLLDSSSGVDTEFILKNGEKTNDLSKEISAADIEKIKFTPLSIDKIQTSITGSVTNFSGAIYKCSGSPHIEGRYVFFISERPLKYLRSDNIQNRNGLIICTKCRSIVEVNKSAKEFHLICKCPVSTILVERKDNLLCREHNETIHIFDAYPSAYNILFSPKNFRDERHSMAKIGNRIPVIPPVYRAEYQDRIFFESIGKNDITQAYRQQEESYIRKKFTELLQPKEGFLREKLLKRIVNMSARAVIVPDPELESVDECSLPFKILEQFFEDQVNVWKHEYKEEVLDQGQLDTKIKSRLLEHINNTKFILIRQPSLHKFNVLAFKCTKIREDNVIGINPLVCDGYNADFDGDQMAVFMPITYEAQKELDRMLPSKNIYSFSGRYMFHLAQDMVIGFEDAVKNEMQEVIKRLSPIVNKKKLEEILKDNVIKATDKIKNILDTISGDEEKCEAAQKIMQIGFEFATKYPVSFSYFDLYKLKKELTEQLSKKYDLNKIKDEEKIKELESEVEKYIDKNSVNPVLKFIATGSRGKPENVRQMCLFKGKVRQQRSGDSSKFFIETPFVKGLNEDELFNMAYLSRDNLADKKLTVAKAGDITRNLVEALYEVKIVNGSCDCADKDRGIENCKMDRNNICEKCFKKELDKADSKLKKCFPDDLSDFPIGILTAQTIGERVTQLSMQAYHTGKRGIDIDDMEEFLKGNEKSSRILNEDPYKQINYAPFFEILARKCGKKKETSDWRLKKSIKKVAEDISTRDILSVITYQKGVKILEKTFKKNKEIEVDFSTLKSKLILNKLIEKKEKVELKARDSQEYLLEQNNLDIGEHEVDVWDEFRGADEPLYFKFHIYKRLKKQPTLIMRDDAITWINLNLEDRQDVKYIFEAGLDVFYNTKNKRKNELVPPSSSFTQFKENAIIQDNFVHKRFEEFYKKGRKDEYDKESIRKKLFEVLVQEIKEFEKGRNGYSTFDLVEKVFGIEKDDSKRKIIENILKEVSIPAKGKNRKMEWNKNEEVYKNMLRRLIDEW